MIVRKALKIATEALRNYEAKLKAGVTTSKDRSERIEANKQRIIKNQKRIIKGQDCQQRMIAALLDGLRERGVRLLMQIPCYLRYLTDDTLNQFEDIPASETFLLPQGDGSDDGDDGGDDDDDDRDEDSEGGSDF